MARYYVTLNNRRFTGYRGSICSRGFATREGAQQASDELARAYPYSGRRRNDWGVM